MTNCCIASDEPSKDRLVKIDDNACMIGNSIASYINDVIDFRRYTVEDVVKCTKEGGFVKHPGKFYNCKISRKRGKVFAVATRDIEPGEELYISYGHTYWREKFERTNYL